LRIGSRGISVPENLWNVFDNSRVPVKTCRTSSPDPHQNLASEGLALTKEGFCRESGSHFKLRGTRFAAARSHSGLLALKAARPMAEKIGILPIPRAFQEPQTRGSPGGTRNQCWVPYNFRAIDPSSGWA
jgi:hypothetical protein